MVPTSRRKNPVSNNRTLWIKKLIQ
jgi:hypothetical protein